MNKFALAVVLALGIITAAQGETDAPAPAVSSSLHRAIATTSVVRDDRRSHAVDFALYSTIATYRTLDYFSSNAAFANGGHEYILRQFLVNNSATFIAFEGRRRGRDQRIGSSTMGIAASPASPTG